jgi:hypothetical protein
VGAITYFFFLSYVQRFQPTFGFLPDNASVVHEYVTDASPNVQNAFLFSLRAVTADDRHGHDTEVIESFQSRAELTAQAVASINNDDGPPGILWYLTIGLTLLATQLLGPAPQYNVPYMDTVANLTSKALAGLEGNINQANLSTGRAADVGPLIRRTSVGIRALASFTFVGTGYDLDIKKISPAELFDVLPDNVLKFARKCQNGRKL